MAERSPELLRLSEILYPDVHHFAFVFTDIEAALAQYERFFAGSRVIYRGVVETRGNTYRGAETQYAMDLAFVDIGNTVVELFQPIGHARSPYHDFLRDNPAGGLHHVGYTVDSIDDRLASVRAGGGAPRVIHEGLLDNGLLRRYVYVDGLLPGTLVELMELPDEIETEAAER